MVIQQADSGTSPGSFLLSSMYRFVFLPGSRLHRFAGEDASSKLLL
jgi:hypothetical protein